MIVAAVVCPHPPLLLRELCGEQDAVPELRSACHAALSSALAAQPDAVVVVGGADEAGTWDPSLPLDVRRFGTSTAPHVAGLPLSLGVAKRLLEDAGWVGPVHLRSVPFDADPGEVSSVAGEVANVVGRVVLMVLADGSACRGEKAPGYLDQRAFAFDDQVVAALEHGDAPALGALDAALARELMVLGRAALSVMGEVVEAQETAREAETPDAPPKPAQGPRTRVLYRDDPYGVQYTVATWDLERA